MPDRISFFDNFLLRASTRQSLNDPFEARPSFNFWVNLCLELKYDRFGKTREEIISFLEKQDEKSVWSELGISFFHENGIISLTETKDNLLMWSHYAAQHKGIVIEFDVDNNFFCSSYLDNNNTYIGNVRRVKYRKDRVQKGIYDPYFQKSDEWIYEKEHRLLLPLHLNDVLLTPKKKKKELIQTGLSESDFIDFSDELYQIKHHSGFNPYDKEIMHMFKVPAKSIISITFGCQADHRFVEKVISKLKENMLHNVKLYRSKIDKYDYKVNFFENK